MKGTKKKFVPIKKIWEPHEISVRNDLKEFKRAVGLNGALLRATDKTYKWQKSPDLEKQCGGMIVLPVLLERLNFGKSGSRYKQIKLPRSKRKAVYETKYEAKRNTFKCFLRRQSLLNI